MIRRSRPSCAPRRCSTHRWNASKFHSTALKWPAISASHPASKHPHRRGLIGRSTGGHYAALAPATDKRVKATVVWGAMYNLRNITEIPHHVLRCFMYVSGINEPAEAREFFECINLEGYAEKITCPMLVVHGGRDVVTPMENATRLMREARGEIETLIWADSMHCCHDRSHIVRPR